MSNRKAVLFFRTQIIYPDNPEVVFECYLKKLRKYAQDNNFKIIREFFADEEIDYDLEYDDYGEVVDATRYHITSSSLFSEVINFVKMQEGKFFLICYNESSSGKRSNPIIYNEYKDLLDNDKIKIVNYCHPSFVEPPDSTKVWRYINLPKFIDFIKTETLHFTRADDMRKMDGNEGLLFTKKHKEINKESSEENIGKENRRNFVHEQKFVKQVYINCWHINNSENFAMWKVYSDNFGLCLQSTYGDLNLGFNDDEWGVSREDKRIFAGKVNYINAREKTIPQDHSSRPFMYKIEEFTYENELRLIIYDPNEKSQFKKIKVNPKKLINRIYISPFAPDWFEDVVKDLCQKYGISSEIIKSEMN